MGGAQDDSSDVDEESWPSDVDEESWPPREERRRKEREETGGGSRNISAETIMYYFPRKYRRRYERRIGPGSGY